MSQGPCHDKVLEPGKPDLSAQLLASHHPRRYFLLDTILQTSGTGEEKELRCNLTHFRLINHDLKKNNPRVFFFCICFPEWEDALKAWPFFWNHWGGNIWRKCNRLAKIMRVWLKSDKWALQLSYYSDWHENNTRTIKRS